MEDFDQYMKENADESERSAARKVKKGLTGLRLENKVAAAATQRRALFRRRFWWRFAVLAALVLIAGAAVLFLLNNQAAGHGQTPEQEPFPSQKGVQHDNRIQTPQSVLPDGRKRMPMAENRPAASRSPRLPAPAVRGENSEDYSRQKLLDKLWFTDYPPVEITFSNTFLEANQLLRGRDFSNAYVQLQRQERGLSANDTLRFLLGYCLMEMGQGSDAIAYFEKLDLKQPSWKMRLQWYRGMSLLLTGKEEEALLAFRKIAAEPRHTFYRQSKQAIGLLENAK